MYLHIYTQILKSISRKQKNVISKKRLKICHYNDIYIMYMNNRDGSIREKWNSTVELKYEDEEQKKEGEKYWKVIFLWLLLSSFNKSIRFFVLNCSIWMQMLWW